MNQQFAIAGMTCSSCETVINIELAKIKGVNTVKASKALNSVDIETDHSIRIDEIKSALNQYPKYKIENVAVVNLDTTAEVETSSWLKTYKPILLVFSFLIVIALSSAFGNGAYLPKNFNLFTFLHNFMTGFFLTFAFFKLLDVKGFADSFRRYDIIAKAIPSYAIAYPFIELGIGLACLLMFQLRIVYIAEIAIMAIGLIGVVQSNLKKETIQCACLGSVFNLPMSTVTIIENSLMIIFGGVLLII